MLRFSKALLLTLTVAAWGCGGKEPPPPPGVQGDTKAPVIDMGTEKAPPADPEAKK